MTPGELLLGLMALLLLRLALSYRRSWLSEKARSQHWFSVAMGEKPMLNEGQACRIVRDLFSTEHDVERLRDWREQRALRSSDHTTLHHFPADSDREAVGHLLRASGGKVQ